MKDLNDDDVRLVIDLIDKEIHNCNDILSTLQFMYPTQDEDPELLSLSYSKRIKSLRDLKDKINNNG